ESRAVSEFAEGLDEIVVVEEKRDLVESQLRGALYDLPARPRVHGKRDADGRTLFPWHGELDADAIAERLGPRLVELGAGVAAGIDITFKLLYNRHVAMTGGQDPTGAGDVPSLTRSLEAEGVRRTIVVSEQPDAYRGVELARNATVYPRERYEEAMREL